MSAPSINAPADGPSAVPTPLDRIGGTPALREAVERFYAAVLADPHLQPYFAGTDVARVKRHQVLLLASVLGGPAADGVADLAQAHRYLGVTPQDYDRVVGHLLGTLRGMDVPADVVDTVSGAVEGARAGIVTRTGD